MAPWLKLISVLAAIALLAAALQLRDKGLPPEATIGFAESPQGELFAPLLVRVDQSDLFTLRTDLDTSPDGLALTRNGSAHLSGKMDSSVHTLLVNGTAASIDTVAGTWSYILTPDTLRQGVNRIVVDAFSAPDRESLLGQRSLDIFFDNGNRTEAFGVLPDNGAKKKGNAISAYLKGIPWRETRWTAEKSPYHVTADVVVPPYHRLVIEPGATVFFDKGTRLLIKGELVAAGTEYERIHLRATPGQQFTASIRPELKHGPPHWSGVQFEESQSNHNLIEKTDIEYAQSSHGSIGAYRSRLRVDDVRIRGTHEFMIFTDDSSIIVQNSVFEDMFAADEFPIDMTPPIDNTAEHIKGKAGVSFPENGFYIIRNNYFGTNKGHNDIIDVDSNQYPDAVLQVTNNYFAGSGDEAIDGGGDILVEGNIFRNFKKDRDNDGDGESNVISTGDTLNTMLVMTRNIFLDVDHVVNFKKGAFGYFENNTVVGITEPHYSLETNPPHRLLDFSVINLLIPNQDDPSKYPARDRAGLGAYTAGNIYVDVPQTIFGNPDLNPWPNDPKGLLKYWLRSVQKVSTLEVHRSLVESADQLSNAMGTHGRVFDYDIGRAEFVDAERLNFSLSENSPGRRAGPNGLNMGALVAAGASISGEPRGTVSENEAILSIGGPGIFSFIYRVNEGDWSKEIAISDPRDYNTGNFVRSTKLELKNLNEGKNTVYVRGRNFAGELQSSVSATVSRTWIVQTAD
jgi:hypothetical protein